MLFQQILFTFSLAFFFQTFSFASPVQTQTGNLIVRDVGPSGEVKYPYGGQFFDNTSKNAKLFVSYTQVSHADAQTISIDLHIGNSGSPPSSSDTLIASRLTRDDTCSPIEAYFAIGEWCGELALFVTEHQLYFGKLIKFQSAAPTFIVNC